MYPVISNLRRSAMKIIYTNTPEVDLKGGKHLSLDISSLQWHKSTRPVMSEITVSSNNKAETAVKLCIFENEVYEKAGLSKIKYTLILGEETESDGKRTARIGLLKGIFFSEQGGGVAKEAQQRSSSNRRPLPEGVILDER